MNSKTRKKFSARYGMVDAIEHCHVLQSGNSTGVPLTKYLKGWNQVRLTIVSAKENQIFCILDKVEVRK